MRASERSSVHWRKSTRSGHEGGDCVEVADVSRVVAIRDSKEPDGPVLSFARPAFRALARQIRAGRYDL